MLAPRRLHINPEGRTATNRIADMALFLFMVGVLSILIGQVTFGLICLGGTAVAITTAILKIRSLAQRSGTSWRTTGSARQSEREARFCNLLLLMVLIIVGVAIATLLTSSTHGQTRGQIASVEISASADTTVFRVKMRGDPARTFVATYTSREDIQRGRELLQAKKWVILDYHGPMKGGDQVIDEVTSWDNR